MTVAPTVTPGEERDRLYAMFKARGENFVKYERKAPRTIAVVRLRPIAEH